MVEESADGMSTLRKWAAEALVSEESSHTIPARIVRRKELELWIARCLGIDTRADYDGFIAEADSLEFAMKWQDEHMRALHVRKKGATGWYPAHTLALLGFALETMGENDTHAG